MTDKIELVSEYEAHALTVERLHSELLSAQENARATLEALMGAHGKGPFAVNGKEVVVLRRRGTMCTMPAVRVRKNPKNKPRVTASAPVTADVVEDSTDDSDDTDSDDSDSDITDSE